MRKKKMIVIFILLSIGIYTGCAGQSQTAEEPEAEEANAAAESVPEETLQRESVLYQKYRETLYEIDKNREACFIFGENGWENAQDSYRETISETVFGMCAHNNYHWETDPMNEMKGILAAEEMRDNGGNEIGFGLRIAVSEADELWEYSYFEYSYFDMKYITCLKTGEKEGDVPEYQLCEEILYHGKVSDNNGETEWAEWLEEYGRKSEGETKEYCVIDNHIYRIDREKEQFYDVTGQTESYMAEWLQWEKERACYGMQVAPETVENVKELIPDGYCLKNETDVAVCDLNHDGEEDYVVSIYDPVTMSKEEYYDAAEDMWMFLSNGNGEYTKKILVENRLYCYDLRFVADGILMCENLLGMDSYGRPVRRDYFLYDDETEEFYIDKVCQCERYSGVLIEDKSTLKRLTVDEYYHSGIREDISSVWKAVPFYDVDSGKGRKVEFDSDVTYRNADKETEKSINDKIFEVELVTAEKLLRESDDDIRIKSCLNYLNPHIYVGSIEGTISKKSNDNVYYTIPVMIDLKSGGFLDITDLISKEDFIGICQKGIKDRYRNELSQEDRERAINLVEKEYENALRIMSSGELMLMMRDTWICFEISSWGVQITGKDDTGDIRFILDKEYFIDTPLWYYMRPDFLQNSESNVTVD